MIVQAFMDERRALTAREAYLLVKGKIGRRPGQVARIIEALRDRGVLEVYKFPRKVAIDSRESFSDVKRLIAKIKAIEAFDIARKDKQERYVLAMRPEGRHHGRL